MFTFRELLILGAGFIVAFCVLSACVYVFALAASWLFAISESLAVLFVVVVFSALMTGALLSILE